MIINHYKCRCGIAICGISLALFSKVGLSSIWQFFYVGRLITLFALINIPVMPSGLIVFFKAMQILSLDFIPNLFNLIPLERSAEDYSLKDNAKYHPNIFLLTESPSNYLFFL